MSRNRFDIPALTQARRGQLRVVQCINEIGDCTPLPCRRGTNVIAVHRRNCRALVGALLTGGVALGALEVAGTADGEPSNPGADDRLLRLVRTRGRVHPVPHHVAEQRADPGQSTDPSVNVGVQSAVP